MNRTEQNRQQRSDIWSQASYRYPISWEAFVDPSHSYFLFADFVDFIHIEHTFCICPFLVAFFSATIDGRNLIFGHKLHIGTPYRGTRQIPTSCLPKSEGIVSEHQLTVHLLNSAFTEKQLGGYCTTAGTTTECLDSNQGRIQRPGGGACGACATPPP